MIEAVSFGCITIDGKRFTSDVVIYPDGHVADAWWRERGHSLSEKDIARLIDTQPEVIVAGTGMSGLMKPVPGLSRRLSEIGIELIAAENPSAMALFNDRTTRQRVGACFHLTC